MLRVGITGGLGSGKSLMAQFLRAKGAFIFDADREAKFILLRDESVNQEIIMTFGDAVLNEIGELDFRRLASHAFTDAEHQLQLNAIVHPRVLAKAEDAMIRANQDKEKLFIFDAALLFEAKGEAILDFTILITADPELRIKRAVERGTLTEEDIRRRMALQMSDEEREAHADYIIQNNEGLDEYTKQMEMLYDSVIGPELS